VLCDNVRAVAVQNGSLLPLCLFCLPAHLTNACFDIADLPLSCGHQHAAGQQQGQQQQLQAQQEQQPAADSGKASRAVRALPEAEKQVSVTLNNGGPLARHCYQAFLQAYGCLAVAVYICKGEDAQHNHLFMCSVTSLGLYHICLNTGVSSQAPQEGCCHRR
jgi:hypothetical protein